MGRVGEGGGTPHADTRPPRRPEERGNIKKKEQSTHKKQELTVGTR